MTYLINKVTLEIQKEKWHSLSLLRWRKELEEPARVNEDQTSHSSQQDCCVETTLNHTDFSVTQ